MARLDEFKSQLKGGGARPNLYRVIMPFPAFAGNRGNSEQLRFLCKAASLPASTLGVIEVPFEGRQLKVPGDRQFVEWTITLFNDTTFQVRDALERWMTFLNAHAENVSAADPSAGMVDCTVEQLGRNGQVLKTYKMKGVWPSEVSTIDLAWDNNDQVEEYTVNLQVQYWTSNSTDE